MEVFNWFSAMTPLRHIRKSFVWGNYLEPEDIEAFALSPSVKGPYFVFAHFFQIHDMVATDQGRAQQKHVEWFIRDEKTKCRFQKIHRCFKKKMVRLVEKIQAVDPGAIILVTSDHGHFNAGDQPDTAPEAQALSQLVLHEEGVPKVSERVMNRRLHNLIACYVPPSSVQTPGYRALFLRRWVEY